MVINIANKEWDDVPYNAGDCISDHSTWNDAVSYIKHKGSCSLGGGYTLYDDDDSSNIWWEFYENAIDIKEDRALYINNDDIISNKFTNIYKIRY